MCGVNGNSSEDQLRQALAAFDAAFAGGTASELSELFAEDAELLLLYAPAIVGRAAIRDAWTALFDTHDTSDWQSDYAYTSAAGDLGVTIGTYTERLLERATGQATLVRGRVVYVWRRDPDERWRIVRALNSHTHQPEPL
jgi:ketosteroid isomerase-like protein